MEELQGLLSTAQIQLELDEPEPDEPEPDEPEPDAPDGPGKRLSRTLKRCLKL